MNYAFDHFNRTNNSSSLGTSDSGHSWTAHSGTWGILSNGAYASGLGGDAFGGAASIDLGASTQIVQAVVPSMPLSSGTGVCARLSDGTNYWFAFIYRGLGGSYFVYAGKYVAGTNTYSVANAVGLGGGPWVLKLVLDASDNVSVYVNGVQKGSTATDSFNNTATRCGLMTNGTTGGPYLEDFQAASEGVLTTDDFERANGSIGTSSSGDVWNVRSGTFNIVSTSKVEATGGTSDLRLATLDHGNSDGVFSASSGTGGGGLSNDESWGVLLRYEDDNNWLAALISRQGGSPFAHQLLVYKRVAGTLTGVDGPTTVTWVGGLRIIATISGTNLDVVANDVTRTGITVPSSPAGNHHGLYSFSSPGTQFEDWYGAASAPGKPVAAS